MERLSSFGVSVSADFSTQTNLRLHHHNNKPEPNPQHPEKHRRLDVEFWMFSGAWLLVLGASAASGTWVTVRKQFQP